MSRLRGGKIPELAGPIIVQVMWQWSLQIQHGRHKLYWQLLTMFSRPIRHQLPYVLHQLPEWSDLCCGLRLIKRLRSSTTATVLQLQLVQ